eukprot:5757192-Prymnesium_polylepis.1
MCEQRIGSVEAARSTHGGDVDAAAATRPLRSRYEAVTRPLCSRYDRIGRWLRIRMGGFTAQVSSQYGKLV